MRGSNFPECSRMTYCDPGTFTTNSYYTMDGRYAHAEGMWNLIGTGDQMWMPAIDHMMAPDLVFQELSWRGRGRRGRPPTHKPPVKSIMIFEPRKDGEECPWDQWDHPCLCGERLFQLADLNCGSLFPRMVFYRDRITSKTSPPYGTCKIGRAAHSDQ